MRPLRVLVVEDEKPARERLRRLLTRDPRVQLVACYSGGHDAIAAIRAAQSSNTPVELMFLDVQMPELDGFGVVSSLMKLEELDEMPALVFVTAHDEYALKAFETHAVDYLLKPFDDERFQAALDSAIRHVRAGHAHALLERMHALLGSVNEPHASPAGMAPQRTALDRIVVKSAHRVRLLSVDQITWIEADGMYVKLHTRDGAIHLHRGLLRSLETSLDARRFVRIHRSAIVNIDLVNELRQDEYGNYIALLRDRTEVRVGRRFRARLQERLGQSL